MALLLLQRIGFGALLGAALRSRRQPPRALPGPTVEVARERASSDFTTLDMPGPPMSLPR